MRDFMNFHQHSSDKQGHSCPSHAHSPFKWAIAINFGYVVIQTIFALHAHSNSLFADAAHNLGDVLGLFFAFISTLLHEKSSTNAYSYGFKKTTILAALSNALILIFTCGLIGYDSILKLIHPGEIAELDVILVASAGILINGGSALFFMKGQHDLTIRSAFLHLAYDSLISLGVLLGAVLIYFTHWYWLDPLLGIGIMAMILTGTLSLLKSTFRLVMDGVPPGLDVGNIKKVLSEKPYVIGVHDLHVWALSTKENILTAHIQVRPEALSMKSTQELSLLIEENFNIHHVTLQLEEANCEKGCQ